jgi:hypothetical protein
MSSKSKARKNSEQRSNPEISSQLSKRYHEIGIKAVAAALQNQDSAQNSAKQKTDRDKRNHDNARENADE